jgi:hypothetical protein
MSADLKRKDSSWERVIFSTVNDYSFGLNTKLNVKIPPSHQADAGETREDPAVL